MANKTYEDYFRSVMSRRLFVGACVLCTKAQEPSHNGLNMMEIKGFKSIEIGDYVPGFRVHCPKAATHRVDQAELFTFAVPVDQFDSAELAVNAKKLNDMDVEFGRDCEDKPFTPKHSNTRTQFLKIRIVPGQEFDPLFVRVDRLDIENCSTVPEFYRFNASVRNGIVSVGLRRIEDKKDLPHFWQE